MNGKMSQFTIMNDIVNVSQRVMIFTALITLHVHSSYLYSILALFNVIAKHCTNGNVRLTQGRNETEGILQLCVNNQMSLVCKANWTAREAQVLCRSIGYPFKGERIHMHIIIMISKWPV